MSEPDADQPGWASPGAPSLRKEPPGQLPPEALPAATGQPPGGAPTPAHGQPGSGQPGSGQPGSGQPGSGQPVYGQPTYGQPTYGQPGSGQPGVGQLGPGQPGFGQPGWGAPPGWGAAADAPRPGVVPLRPLGLGELLDGAVGLIRGYPRATLGALLIIALLLTLLQVVLLLTVLRPVFELDAVAVEAGDTEELVRVFTSAFAGLSLQLVVTSLADAALAGLLAAVAGKAVLGQPLGFGQLRQEPGVRPGRLLAASALYTLATYLPFIAGVVLSGLIALAAPVAGGLSAVVLVPLGVAGSVWLYVRYSLATSALVLERARPLTAFRRSARLARGSFWRLLGVLLLTFVIAGFVSQVLQVPFSLLADSNPLALFTGDVSPVGSTRALLATALATGVTALLVSPFSAGVRALLYVDRRMRSEGLDVALQSAAQQPPLQGDGAQAAPPVPQQPQ